MKKLVRGLFLVLAIISLLSFSAFAEYQSITTVNGVTASADETGEWLVVTYSKEAGAVEGSYYLLIVQKENANGEANSGIPSEDNVLYIDQREANSNGVTFDPVFPSSLASGGTYGIYLYSNDGVANGTRIATFKYSGGFLMGDVDDDGEITPTDALWILQRYAGTRTSFISKTTGAVVPDETGIVRPQSGSEELTITPTDALWVLQAYAGNRTL